MNKKILSFIVTALLIPCLLAGCAGTPGTPDNTGTTGETSATEQETTDVLATDQETSATAPENTTDAGSLSAYQGEWFDVNGDTVLEITDDTLTIRSGEYSEQYACKLSDTPVSYIVPAEENGYFGILSDIEICEDGSLSAYQMVMDAEGHTYKFVRKEELEKEREIVDESFDAPKEIVSDDIELFLLSFRKTTPNSYELSEDWPVGHYSWEIEKQSDGSYRMDFRISGDSYMILTFTDTVTEDYVKGLSQLIKEEKIPEWNGYYKKNNVKRPGWSLFVNYASDESLSVSADGDAAETCVFDLAPLLDYAALQDLNLDW